MWEWVLIAAVIFVSMLVGFALGRILQIIEDRETRKWNAPTKRPEENTPHIAPGADWGTWSTSTH